MVIREFYEAEGTSNFEKNLIFKDLNLIENYQKIKISE